MRPLSVLGVLALACQSTLQMPAPAVTAVRPARGYNALAVTVQVSGTGFALLPQKMLSPDEESIRFPTVILETNPPTLLATTMLGPTELLATVPAGLAPGTYGVSVVNPDGGKHTLAAAFTVTDQPEIRLDRVTPPFGWHGARTLVSIQGLGFVSTPRVKLSRTTAGGVEEIEATRVAFIDERSITALVPQTSAAQVGTWDVVVQNPDQGFGLAQGAFTITRDPPPSVSAVSPAVGSGTLSVTIAGQNFRPGAAAVLIDEAGNRLDVFTGETLNGSTEIQATLVVPSTNGPYLVRVENTDQTYGDFSAFVSKPASLKLSTLSVVTVPGSSDPRRLSRARRGLVALSAKDDLGNTFLYAVGGESGSEILDTVEVAQVDPFGRLSAWRTVPNPMPARSRHGAVALGGYVYVLGGMSPEGATDTILRAAILPHSHAPVVTRAEPSAGGALAAGTWYYQVAGVNENGETLPSDEVTVQTQANGKVTLEWSAIPGGATAYRVYRSGAPNAVSGSERRIAEVGGETLTFVDDGRPPGTTPPLPPGSLGTFSVVGRLSTARAGLAVTVGHHPSGARFLYALGGENAGGALASYDRVRILPGDALSDGVAQGALPHSVVDGAAVLVDEASAPALEDGAGSFVYLVSGVQGDSGAESVLWAHVPADGALAFAEVSGNTPSPRRGLNAVCANNVVYLLGGFKTASETEPKGNQSVITGGGSSGGEPSSTTWNSGTSAGLAQSRALYGLVIANAFVYAVGGENRSAGVSTLLDTIERGLW